MNSQELAYRLSRIAMDSSSGCAHPPPPESLPSSSPYELDCSRFDSMSSTASLSYSSFSTSSYSSSSSSRQEQPQGHQLIPSSPSPRGMIKGWGSAMSRTRCMNSLSSLASTSSFGSGFCSESSQPTPNEGWGYFADTPSK